MRLLIVTDAFPPRCGGSGWSTFHLVKALLQNEHEVRVVKPEPGFAGVRRRTYDGIEVSEIGFFFRNVPYLRSFLRDHVLRRRLHEFLLRELDERPVDLVHAQHVMSAAPSISAACELGLPVVVTIRDHWPICYFTTWHVGGERCPDCTFSKMLACMKQKSPDAYWAGIPLMPYMRKTVREKQHWLKKADTVIAVSRYIADNVVRPIVGEAATRVIPNPISLETVRRALQSPSGVGLPKRFLLFVGKLSRSKGALFVLDVVARLRHSIPLVMVGAGPDRAAIQSRAGSEGLDVHFIPWVDNVDVWRIMSRATLVLVPSLWPEALSRTVTEAMAVGAPIAATDCGGIHDQIRHQKSGLIFPADPSVFAEGVAALLADPAKGRELAEEAHRRAETMFDDGVVIPQLESLYRDLVERHGRS